MNHQAKWPHDHCTKLTEAQVREIRASPLPHAAIAERFGISRKYVSHIKCRRYWKGIK